MAKSEPKFKIADFVSVKDLSSKRVLHIFEIRLRASQILYKGRVCHINSVEQTWAESELGEKVVWPPEEEKGD